MEKWPRISGKLGLNEQMLDVVQLSLTIDGARLTVAQTEKPSMDLRFVNVSNPKESKTGASRKLVRSHAMRNFRHQQRLESENNPTLLGSKPAPHGLASKSTNLVPSGGGFRHIGSELGNAEEESEEDIHTPMQKIARPAPLDNIELFPVPFSQEFIFRIFDHYGGAIAGGLLPLGKFVATNPLRTRVLPLAMRDNALFHIILATAGMDMMVWRGEIFFDPLRRSTVRGLARGNEFCIKHKIEGIRAINERLNNSVMSISDETMLAVCHLASLEILASAMNRPDERFKDVHIHMDGMEQMVKLRGGLKAIGPDNCVSQLIIRVDHLYSALTGRRPRFPVEELFAKDSGPIIDTQFRAPYGLASGVLSPALESIIHQLRTASEFLEKIKDPISESDFFAFGIKRCAIENSLFKLGTTTGNGLANTLGKIDQCCQLGAILYIQTVLTKVNCRVYRDLCTALRRKIEQVTPDVVNGESANLLLWLLLIGGGAAPYNADRLWYIAQLVVCLRTTTWEEIKERLEEWPWRPKYCVIWRQVWRDAVRVKMGSVISKTT